MQKLCLRCTPLFILVAISLAGCNWVDSTGRQENFDPVSELRDGDVIADLEEETRELSAAAQDSDGVVQSYLWSDPLEQGALAVCEGSIDLSIAGEDLLSVCEDTDNCGLLFFESDEEAGLFTVMLPKVTAPIGVTHELVVEDNDGGKTRLNIHFCIDSVNEKPIANNDQYAVTEGDSLVISADDVNNLLSNDLDDLDVRNEKLTVLGVVEDKGPKYADEFEIDAGGGFVYNISPLTPFNATKDSFVYQVSDGTHTSEATVELDLSVNNDAPIVIGTVGPQTAIVGHAFDPLNIANNFSDPEDQPLTYSAEGLPTGISIEASSGIISGTAEATNSIGDYDIIVSASDGQNTVSLAPFSLSLEPNQPPFVETQLPDQEATVGVPFVVDAGASFADADSAVLVFRADNLPESFAIEEASGIISGTAVVGEEATYGVSVIADDGIDTTTMQFELAVLPNQPPVFEEPIVVPNAIVGFSYSLDTADFFTDPEGDAMTFTASGLPPSGTLTMSSEGVIFGIPADGDQNEGIFSFYTVEITATDIHGNQGIGTIQLRIR